MCRASLGEPARGHRHTDRPRNVGVPDGARTDPRLRKSGVMVSTDLDGGNVRPVPLMRRQKVTCVPASSTDLVWRRGRRQRPVRTPLPGIPQPGRGDLGTVQCGHADAWGVHYHVGLDKPGKCRRFRGAQRLAAGYERGSSGPWVADWGTSRAGVDPGSDARALCRRKWCVYRPDLRADRFRFSLVGFDPIERRARRMDRPLCVRRH